MRRAYPIADPAGNRTRKQVTGESVVGICNSSTPPGLGMHHGADSNDVHVVQ